MGINADSSTIDGNLQVLEKLLKRFHQAGFSVVEIPVHGVGCILGGELRQTQTDRVRRILDSYPLQYTVHGPDPVNLCDGKAPEVHASALRATIDFARAIGAKVVVYHGSFRDGEPDTNQPFEIPPVGKDPVDSEGSEWTEEIERLKRIGEYAEKQGITVAVENIFRQGTERTYRIDPCLLAEVIQAVGSSAVGICFDFGHAFLSAKEEEFSYQEAVRAVLPHLVHVHVHDNLGIPVSSGSNGNDRSGGNGRKPLDAFVLGEGDLHLPPGWGRIPYDEVLPDVIPSYRGVWMMEIHPRFAEAYEGAIRWIKSKVGNRNFSQGASEGASNKDPFETTDPYQGIYP